MKNLNNWDDYDKIMYIWEVGITRDFDIVGYVYAENEVEALNKALDDNYIKKYKKYNIRVNKLKGYKDIFKGNVSTKESYDKIRNKLIKIAIRASHNVEQFIDCQKQWESDNNN